MARLKFSRSTKLNIEVSLAVRPSVRSRFRLVCKSALLPTAVLHYEFFARNAVRLGERKCESVTHR